MIFFNTKREHLITFLSANNNHLRPIEFLIETLYSIEGDEGADTHTHDLPEAVTTSNEDTQRVHTLHGDCEKTNTIVEELDLISTIVLVFSQSPFNV